MKKEIKTYDEIMSLLIDYMVEYRKREGITQQALSDKSGVAQPVIARIEKKKTDPQMSTFCKLIKSLGINLKPEKENIKINEEIAFAFGINTLDGPTPSKMAINIVKLFLNEEIDYETARFAIKRLRNV